MLMVILLILIQIMLLQIRLKLNKKQHVKQATMAQKMLK